MDLLRDKPIKCYHKALEAVFEVLSIDWEIQQVKVRKATINHGQDLNIDSIPAIYSFSEVKIIRFTGRLDDNKKEIYEGNLVAYGPKLAFMGTIKFSQSKDRWVIENITGSGEHSNHYFLSEISPQLIHIIDNSGREIK